MRRTLGCSGPWYPRFAVSLSVHATVTLNLIRLVYSWGELCRGLWGSALPQPSRLILSGLHPAVLPQVQRRKQTGESVAFTAVDVLEATQRRQNHRLVLLDAGFRAVVVFPIVRA